MAGHQADMTCGALPPTLTSDEGIWILLPFTFSRLQFVNYGQRDCAISLLPC
jgi:hypothetical protein